MNSRKSFGRRGLDETKTKRNPVFITQSTPALAGPARLEDDNDISIGTVLWNCLAFVFSFKGRLGRAMYWYCTILHVALLALFVSATFLRTASLELTIHSLLMEYFWASPIILALSVFSWSVTVRRMHDRNVSGYWVFSWFIPFAGVPICLVQTFKNMFFAGTPGRNKFGI
ncbi:DUF805 domain-containing protein [Labrenzia sp. PHM005]|uniref:DUF805 domain-containing protein n=1 Tax=Labrenzia sp. PHM005 TaxID=2590016 RepID=UPI001140842C|nr:DUF805 domain-containing protein [Labrenzia sp. PHM005]QDG79225.1 DUF805 domain-containing protein [Labrenzia sp. PHM005]